MFSGPCISVCECVQKGAEVEETRELVVGGLLPHRVDMHHNDLR